MGVVYKLKQEVIDFITNAKRKTPKISCRKLASLTSETFNTKVSKSSVNSVLKNAQLSSSVGRRTGSKHPKAFSIPKEKKEQINKDILKTNLISPKIDNTSTQKKPDNVIGQEEKPEEPIINRDIVEENKQEHHNKEKTALSEDIVTEEQEEPRPSLLSDMLNLDNANKEQQEQYSEEKSFDNEELQDLTKECVEVNNAGCVFYQAAMWTTGIKEIVLSTIRRYFPQAVETVINDDILAASLLLNCFANKEIRNNIIKRRNFAPYCFNNDIKLENIDEADKFLSGLDHHSKVSAAYKFARNTVNLKVGGFQAVLEDNSKLMFGPLMNFCGKRIIKSKAIPIWHALTLLAKIPISNNHPFFIDLSSGMIDQQDIGLFASSAMASNGKTIRTIDILDEKLEVILSFKVTPAVKKEFILLTTQNNGFFDVLTKSAKWSQKQSFTSDLIKSDIKYVVTSTECFKAVIEGTGTLNVFTLFQGNKEEPTGAILTNISSENTENILNKAILCNPDIFYSDKNLQNLAQEDFIKDNQESEFFSHSILEDIQQILTLQAFQWFHNAVDYETFVNDVMPMLCLMAGNVCDKKESFVVQLKKGEHLEINNILYQAAKQINKDQIFTPAGQKLIISPF